MLAERRRIPSFVESLVPRSTSHLQAAGAVSESRAFMGRALAAAVFSLVLAGCANPCLKLAEKLCECSATTTARDSCKSSASNEQSLVTITTDDEERCSALIDQCDCHSLDTPEGKLACGLARDPDAN
jgi:hypothetical protein